MCVCVCVCVCVCACVCDMNSMIKQDVIKFCFCGHTHSNELMIYMTSDKRPLSACWAPGSLYPSTHNPQFNVVKYNKTDGTVLDYDHYECVSCLMRTVVRPILLKVERLLSSGVILTQQSQLGNQFARFHTPSPQFTVKRASQQRQ